MEHIHEENYGAGIIRIYHDDYAEAPDWHFSKKICFHNKYRLGDKHDYDHQDYSGWNEMEKDIIKEEKPHTILPLYLYDHSGITISTTPFSCGWDSGQVGFILMSKKTIKENRLNKERITEMLLEEVEEYDKYLRGEVYQYRIFQLNKEGVMESVEIAGGIYGFEECLKEAKEFIDMIEKAEEVK